MKKKEVIEDAVFELCTKTHDYTLLVSEVYVDPLVLNDKKLFNKHMKSTSIGLGDILIPLASLEEVIDYSHHFLATNFSNEKEPSKNIKDVRVLTKIDLDLEKIEVKQAAVISTLQCSLNPVSFRKYTEFKDEFYIHILYKNKLVISKLMTKDTFFSCEDYDEIIKEELNRQEIRKKFAEDNFIKTQNKRKIKS